MFTIIKNRTLDANFKKLKLIPTTELIGYCVKLTGAPSCVPLVIEKNTGEPAYDTHMVLLDSLTNELCVFEWTSPPWSVLGSTTTYQANPLTLAFDYSGRYVTPPVGSPSMFNQHIPQPRYTQDTMGDGSILTMFEPSDTDVVEPTLSVACQTLRDGSHIGTVTFKRITIQNEMDGKGTTWRLLNNYLCIVQDSSVWYHSNAALAPLTIDQAIEIGLNPIVGLCDANGMHGLESKWITHAPTYHPMTTRGHVASPYNIGDFNPNNAVPTHGFQEVFQQFGETQPTRPMPKGYRSNHY